VTTPFDDAIRVVERIGYHNHRLETHSDTVSDGIFTDLVGRCRPLSEDFKNNVVKDWKNVSSPGDRLRKVDLFVGGFDDLGQPDIHKVRIAVENKSIITAHRNRTNRFDDLSKVLGAIHAAQPEAILIATVLIGLCDRVLNVPDQVHRFFRDNKEQEFNQRIVPRLSSGDQTLWNEFNWAISYNSKSDPAKTLELMRSIPTRKPGHTHVVGYDFVLVVPVLIDNVNPPEVARNNALGVDVDADYERLLEQICAAYTARWHM
jgi:hypothetical protein